MYMLDFGERLRALRKEKGYTQKVIAEKMNVSQNTVVRWENNYKFPTQNNLIQLSRIFHVSLDYLVGTVLNTLVLEFQFRQKGTGLTQRQMNILNAVIVAFTK